MTAMAEKKAEAPGYMLYKEAALMLSILGDEDAGKIIKAACKFFLSGEEPENLPDIATRLIYESIHDAIVKNASKYQKTSERNRRNIEKRYQNATKELPNGYQTATKELPNSYQNATNQNLNQNQNLNVNQSLNVNRESEAATPPTRVKRFAPPTLAEVQSYVAERQSPVDPQEFIDFYAAKGWLVGKTPMKDWKAACRNAEKWDRWQRRAADHGGGNVFLEMLREEEARANGA